MTPEQRRAAIEGSAVAGATGACASAGLGPLAAACGAAGGYVARRATRALERAWRDWWGSEEGEHVTHPSREETQLAHELAEARATLGVTALVLALVDEARARGFGVDAAQIWTSARVRAPLAQWVAPGAEIKIRLRYRDFAPSGMGPIHEEYAAEFDRIMSDAAMVLGELAVQPWQWGHAFPVEPPPLEERERLARRMGELTMTDVAATPGWEATGLSPAPSDEALLPEPPTPEPPSPPAPAWYRGLGMLGAGLALALAIGWTRR